MSLANIGWLGFAIGGVTIVATLFALQQLRVRHHQKIVITTLFWKQAIDETRARTLRERFRHPWAYVLVCLIAGAMWLAFSEPVVTGSISKKYVLILDGSAGMTIGTRFDWSLRELQQQVAQLPRDKTTVLFAGAQLATLLAPNEDRILLRERLRGIQPAACPARLESCVRQIAESTGPDIETSVRVIGATAIEQRFRDLLPDHVKLARSAPETDSLGVDNSGVTQLGLSAARSARWDRVDAIVEVQSPVGVGVANKLSVTIDGQPYPGTIERLESSTDAGGRRERVLLRLADLPADGELLQVMLDADDFRLDDHAEIYLPNRPLIKVAVLGDVPSAVRQVLELDRAVTLVTDESVADVLVTTQAEAGSSRPILLLRDDTSPHAFLFGYDGPQDVGEVVRELFYNLGLDQIDAQELATSTGRVIQLSAERGTVRRVSVWRSLFSPDFDFTRNSAFPAFVGQSVRWLAAQKEVADRVAAGEQVETIREVHFLDRTPMTPGGQPFQPPGAGRYQSTDGSPLAASLLDSEVTQDNLVELDEQDIVTTASRWRFSLVTLLGVVCLGLLFMEWHLFRRGRMP